MRYIIAAAIAIIALNVAVNRQRKNLTKEQREALDKEVEKDMQDFSL